ncbi:invasion associated locus B family protein [Histidinibacterium lentulum]|uniref:invasion associated locus B family protein n=1 Tax=Histidinibacterium lentulum TaxID=2480588 RepID=UPI001621A4D2|nr:invasion associated locus B family protein [Histidinibacterium lentulum]
MAVAGLAAGPSSASVERFQDWEVACVDGGGCVAATTAVAEDRTWLGTVRVREMDDAGGPVMQILAPAGIHLASGLFVELPGRSVKQATFIRCDAGVCEAQLSLTDAEFQTWRRGLDAEIRYRPHVDVSPIVFEVSLLGITAAMRRARELSE